MYDYLLAGWASTDITPCKRVSLQGQNYERISEGVHDPIYATALALQKGNVQVIMVACDLIVIRRPLLLKVRACCYKTNRNFTGEYFNKFNSHAYGSVLFGL